MNGRLVARLVVLSGLMLAASSSVGCKSPPREMQEASAQHREVAAELGPPPAGMCRVVFKRHANILGAGGAHFVVDRGRGAPLDGWMEVKKVQDAERGNFGKTRNIRKLHSSIEGSKALLLVGAPSESGYERVGERKAMAPGLRFGLEMLAASQGVFVDLSSGYDGPAAWTTDLSDVPPNVHLAGTVASGETVHWDRPPGTLRLEAITEGGDQTVAFEQPVEAGKTYVVDYYYGSAAFAFSVVD